MFGVDNTFLSRVARRRRLRALRGRRSRRRAADLRRSSRRHEVTPVDFGDVCVNYDRTWFAEHGLEPPADLGDLADPGYRDLLVVQNPATSSPGLAFLAATVAEYGDDGWQEYWERAARQRRRGGRRLDRGVLRALHRRQRRRPGHWSSATAPARRPRWCSPTRRSTSRPRRRDRRRRASARSSSPACCAAPTPGRGRAARRLPAHADVPARAALDAVRVPGERPTSRCPRCSRPTPRCPPTRTRSTRRRSPPTGRPGSTSGPRSCCGDARSRIRHRLRLAVAAAARARPARRSSPCSTSGPFVTLLARGLVAGAVAETLGRGEHVAGRCGSRVAGRRQHRAHARRRAGARLRDRPLPLPRSPARSPACSRRCSCSRPS